ncbi:MAG: response regulator [Deltaproteobacteria bacterium]|nr:response regulator [Deltaproteobacteria bacterium]
MLASIWTAAHASRDTMRRLQEFHRADPRPKMEEVNVAELVSEIVAATKPLWRPHGEVHSVPVKIIEEVLPDLVVTLSKSQFGEALMNLLLNALHAISNGGEVTIRTFVKDENFNLEVRNTGIGMSKDVVRNAWNLSFQRKAKNGSLNIDSIPGAGTTFTIQIPLEQDDNGIKPDAKVFSQIARSLKVLVVDDDENTRTLVSEYLSFDSHSVTTAVNSTYGIAKFNQNEFDLVITNKAMPKISGDELAQHGKTSDRRVPVLMITGFAQIMAFQGEHPTGVDYIVGKPFTLQELRNAIERIHLHNKE